MSTRYRWSQHFAMLDERSGFEVCGLAEVPLDCSDGRLWAVRNTRRLGSTSALTQSPPPSCCICRATIWRPMEVHDHYWH
jgi:hypothetical protein